MAFDFREEAITEMYGMYQGVLESLHEQINDVTQNIIDKAKEMQYKPMVDLCSAATKYCNATLKSDIKKTMSNWQDSEKSFPKLLDELMAGEEAISRAKQLEQQIAGSIDIWKGVEDQSASIRTANANAKKEDFERVQQMVRNCVGKLEQLESGYNQKIQEKKADNTIYVSIEPVVLASVAIVKNGFETAISTSFRELARVFEQQDQKAKAMGNNTAQRVKNDAQKIVQEGAQKLQETVRKIIN